MDRYKFAHLEHNSVSTIVHNIVALVVTMEATETEVTMEAMVAQTEGMVIQMETMVTLTEEMVVDWLVSPLLIVM